MTLPKNDRAKGLFALVGALLFVQGCSTTVVSLPYDPTVVSNQPTTDLASSVEMLAVSDHRKHEAHWLGAIRGGLGNPLKTLKTEVPVKDVVRDAFTSALEARGLLASADGDYGLEVAVNQFDCNQYVRREAHLRFLVALVDRSSRQQIYTKDVQVDKVSGSAFSLDAGILADVEDLRKVANQVLQEAVD